VIERFRQTYRHLRVAPDDERLGELPGKARELVALMSPADRRHALEAYDALARDGADEELRLVGLLHDMGKPRRTRLWHRVAAVLAPAACRRLGSRTLREYLDHPARGAHMARALGLSERAIRLIERHHEPPQSAEESLLLRADRHDRA
jgi:putative nucleotidyltransferase with HDIG domain